MFWRGLDGAEHRGDSPAAGEPGDGDDTRKGVIRLDPDGSLAYGEYKVDADAEDNER